MKELMMFYDDFADWLENEQDKLVPDCYPQSVRDDTFPTIDDLYRDYKSGKEWTVEVTFRDGMTVKGINPSRAKEQVMIKSHMLVMSQILDMEVLTDDR